MQSFDAPMMLCLADRERTRDLKREERDSIKEERLLWRAQSFRHLMHLLPGQRILELGCGNGAFTRELLRVSRGECPITAVSFDPHGTRPEGLPSQVTYLNGQTAASELSKASFDYVVGMDLLDQGNCPDVLQDIQQLLGPGGQVLLYQSNPWNPWLKIRNGIARLLGKKPSGRLLNRSELYELMSELGFIRVFAVYTDFVPSSFRGPLTWLMRNLSVLLENAPGVRALAGTIAIHAQKPPRTVARPRTSLFEHESLRNQISVVVPCHNEEMNVEPLVTRLRDLYGDYLHEIVLVDDNSRDRTRAVIERLAEVDSRIRPVIRTPPNGVGRAIADGMKAATGQWVLTMDCDFQHLLPEIRDLIDAAAEGYEVIVGSRFSRHSVLLNYPFQKILANRGFHLLANLLLGRRFRDVTNNLKLLHRDVVDQLLLRQPGFSVNAETGLQPLLMNRFVKHVPISWINRTPDMGSSSFRLLKVGGGYWKVLFHAFLARLFGIGPYRTLGKSLPKADDADSPSTPVQSRKCA